MSYDGQVNFGLLADKSLDLDGFAAALDGALEDLSL